METVELRTKRSASQSVGRGSAPHKDKTGAIVVRAMALVVLLPACAPDPLPEIGAPVYESPSFDVWASDGLEACGGTYDYMERWLSDFRQTVDAPADGEHHRFYWVSEDDWESYQPCSLDTAEGCAWLGASSAYSLHIPHEHEVAHIDLGPGNSLVSEGLAQIFGSRRSDARLVGDMDAALFERDLPTADYATAGHFVRFLIERHGLAQVLDWYRATSSRESYRDASDAWSRVSGGDLDVEIEEHAEATRCSIHGWMFDFAECNAPRLTASAGGGWRWTAELDCAADDVMGPMSGQMWSTRTFAVTEPGTYNLLIEPADGQTVLGTIQQCDPGFCNHTTGGVLDLTRTAAVVADGVPTVLEFKEAVFWITLSASVSAPGEVTVHIDPVD